MTAFNPLSLTIDAFGVSFARHVPASDIRLPGADRRDAGALAGSLVEQKDATSDSVVAQVERAESRCHSRSQQGEAEEKE